jgi:hypothetical protein
LRGWSRRRSDFLNGRFGLTGTDAAQLDSLMLGRNHFEGLDHLGFDRMFELSLMLLGPAGFGAFQRLKRQGSGINLGGDGLGHFYGGRGGGFLRHGFLFWRDFGGCCGFLDGRRFGFLAFHGFKDCAHTLVVNGGRVAFDLDSHVNEFFHQFFIGQTDLFR